MDVWMGGWMDGWMDVRLPVCLFVCSFVRLFACCNVRMLHGIIRSLMYVCLDSPM